MELHQTVAENPQTLLERMSRSQLYRLADAVGIEYPKDLPKLTLDDQGNEYGMIPLLKSHNFDLRAAAQKAGIGFFEVPGNDEYGKPRTEVYPERQSPQSERENIDSHAELMRRLEEGNKKVEKLEEDNEALENENRRILEMMDRRLAAIESEKTSLPLEDFLPWQLQRICKNQGIDPKGMTKPMMLEALKTRG